MHKFDVVGAKNNANPSNPCKLDEAHLAICGEQVMRSSYCKGSGYWTRYCWLT